MEVPPSPTGSNRPPTLNEANDVIIGLHNIKLPLDEDPDIDASDTPVTYIVNTNTKFGDREAFVQMAKKYIEEASRQEKLVCI